MKAYHFTNGRTLRDSRPIPAIGKTLYHTGRLALCESGLHASLDILDALRYALGSTLHIVECSGEVIQGSDKLVCRERTILRTIECDTILREFSRWCALQVIHLWDAPPIVREYLETGREGIRAAEGAAAWAAAAVAATAAAWAAAWAAAGDVAGPAARVAARAAAWAATGAVAGNVVGYAARAATNAEAGGVVRDAQRIKLLSMIGE